MATAGGSRGRGLAGSSSVMTVALGGTDFFEFCHSESRTEPGKTLRRFELGPDSEGASKRLQRNTLRETTHNNPSV